MFDYKQIFFQFRTWNDIIIYCVLAEEAVYLMYECTLDLLVNVIKNKFIFYIAPTILLLYVTVNFFSINLFTRIVLFALIIIETFIVREIIHFYMLLLFIFCYCCRYAAPTATGQLSHTFVWFDLHHLFSACIYICWIS